MFLEDINSSLSFQHYSTLLINRLHGHLLQVFWILWLSREQKSMGISETKNRWRRCFGLTSLFTLVKNLWWRRGKHLCLWIQKCYSTSSWSSIYECTILKTKAYSRHFILGLLIIYNNKLVARLANSPCLHYTAELYVQEFPEEIKEASKNWLSLCDWKVKKGHFVAATTFCVCSACMQYPSSTFKLWKIWIDSEIPQENECCGKKNNNSYKKPLLQYQKRQFQGN